MGDSNNNILVDPSNQFIQFEASSNFINFDGSWNNTRSQIQIRNIAGYGGFFKNGGTSIRSNGFNNVAIRNFIVDVSNTTLGGTYLNGNFTDFSNNNANYGLNGYLTSRYYGMGGDIIGGNHTYIATKDLSLNTISNCSFRGFVNMAPGKDVTNDASYNRHRFIGDYASRHSSMTISGCDMSGVRCYMIGDAFGSGVSNAAFSNGKPTITDCSSNNGIAILGEFSGAYNLDTANSSVGLYVTKFRNTGTIYNIYVSGSSIGNNIGINGRLILNECSNSGSINNSTSGGLLGGDPVGFIGAITMNNCSNSGDVNNGGGFFGRKALNGLQYDSSINNCYNTGTIGTSSGGFFASAYLENSKKTLYITNCYNTGNINATNSGGFCGSGFSNFTWTGHGANNEARIIMTKCYNTGQIATGAGGFFGEYTNTSITMNNCFNAGAIISNGCAFVKELYSSSSTAGKLTLNNCYNVGKYTIDLSGVFIGQTNLNNGGPSKSDIRMFGCYDVGNSNPTSRKAPFVGPNIGTLTYGVDISNCYSISTPITGGYTDMSNNFVNSNNPNNGGSRLVQNCYMSPIWSDASAAVLNGTPTSDLLNNPASVWTKLDSGTTTPYVLSSFNAPIYGPSNETINQGTIYRSNPGLFPRGHNGLFDSSNNADFRTKDFSYNLVSVNNAVITSNNITVDVSGGRVNVPNTKRLTSDISKVFVFKSDASSNSRPYNYNFNTYAVRNTLVTDISLNTSSTIDASNNVYIKQNPDKSIWWSQNEAFDSSANITVWPPSIINANGSTTGKNLNVIFMGDSNNNILVDLSNQYIQFEASSNFINFDGSFNSARRSQIQIRNITGYGGFFKNGGTSIRSNGFNNVAIRNFIVDVSYTTLGGSIIPGTSSNIAAINAFRNNLGDYGIHGFLTARYYGMGGDVSGSTSHTYSTSKDLSLNTISNCSFRGTTSSSDTSYANFRFIGDYASRHSSMTISGCDMSGVKSYVIGEAFGSGVIGTMLSNGKPTVRDCSSNTGTLLLGRYSGWFIDENVSGAGLYITNCSNTGSLIHPATAYGASAASIGTNLGFSGRLFIENCSNTGDITGTTSGGLLSRALEITVSSITMNNCWNSGKISGGECGGLFGRSTLRGLQKESYITNCYNYGEISGILAGGLSGGAITLDSDVSLNIVNCYNFGNITNANTASPSGGILGRNGSNDGRYILTNCYNVGTITNANGGFFGDKTSGNIIMNNCFNAGNITGNGSAFSANAFTSIITNNAKKCNITLNNCYNVGRYINDLSGVFIGRTDFSMNTTDLPIIKMTNCYDAGANAGASKAPFVGPPMRNDISGNTFKVDISNCYSISTPITGLYTDMSRNFVDSSNNITIKTITNCYMSPIWSDASADVLTGRPTDLNPGAAWAKFDSIANKPYVLSSYNSPVYDVSNVSQNVSTSFSSNNKGRFTFNHNGLFDSSNNANFRTKDFSYNLLSVNDRVPSDYTNIDGSNSITIDASGGLKFSNQLPSKTPYVANVFVSKSDASSNLSPYNYNLNTFTYRNDYSDTIRNNGNVYIRQNTSSTPNKIQYSLNNASWTDITSENAANGNVTISSFDPSFTNILNVSVTTPITLSTDNSCNFVVKSNYITFDGSYNNTVDGSYNKITFNNLTNYGGFIQNGTDVSNGYYGVKVQNFITDRSGSSTLYSNDVSNNPDADGWLLSSYFGKNSKSVAGFDKARQADTISIKNITNKAPVTSNYAGGIGGSYFGYNSYATIENCSNSGDISGNSAGGILGSRVATNSGEVSITKSYNSAAIRGQGGGGLCGTSAGLPNATTSANDPSSNLTIRNSYSSGHINGKYAGGICGSNIGFTSGTNYGRSNVLIENCYSLGDVTNTNGGKIIGGTDVSNNATFDPSYNVEIDISNCYGYGSDTSSNPNLYGYFPQLTQTSLLKLRQTRWYNALKNKWIDASASQDDGIDGPENLYNNNPGSVWTSVKKNTPYVLAVFNSLIYNPYEIESDESSEYKSLATLFSYRDYSYNLITVNDQDPSLTPISIDASGSLVFPDTITRNKRFTAEVFVSNGVAPYYTNYNYNNFNFTNNSYTIDASGTLYVKQDASGNIVYSNDMGSTWSSFLSGNVTIRNSAWKSRNVLNVLFKSDITVDASNSSAYFDNATGKRENLCFSVKSSYITFDGQNKNITFKNQTEYGGFIKNGSKYVDEVDNGNGYYGIIVKNFNTKMNSSIDAGFLYTNYENVTLRSVEPDSAGWLIGSYFGKNSKTRFEEDVANTQLGVEYDTFDKSKDVVSVQTCTNSGVIYTLYAGGICGSYFGSGNSYATIIGCSNSGDLANNLNQYQGCGGICGSGVGSYGGEVKIYNCSNDGTIFTFNGGGICGSKVADGSGNVLISSCYSVSDINGQNAGGICGQSVGCGNSTVTIQNCYSIGNINGTDNLNNRDPGNNAGGLCGADAGYKLIYSEGSTFGLPSIEGALINTSILNIENCYAIGDINEDNGINGGKLIGGNNAFYISSDSTSATINITKCFTNNSSNSDSGYTSNNIIGNSFTEFLDSADNNYNTNQKRINFKAKTFLVDIFNSQIN
jgi:hypothetical protein